MLPGTQAVPLASLARCLLWRRYVNLPHQWYPLGGCVDLSRQWCPLGGLPYRPPLDIAEAPYSVGRNWHSIDLLAERPGALLTNRYERKLLVRRGVAKATGGEGSYY
jgi:hypothetical protein